MTHIIRTNSTNQDFITLVQYLDQELAIIDGNEHAFYAQFNKIDKIKHSLVAYQDGQPVACGAIKAYDHETMEVKRMYTAASARGKGVASKLLLELEKWAAELGYQKCILETGIRQPDAIALYEKNEYQIISNYGQYTGITNSVCFEKNITEQHV